MVDGCWEICESAVVFPIYLLDTPDRFKKSVIRKIRLIGKSIEICESVAKKFQFIWPNTPDRFLKPILSHQQQPSHFHLLL